MPKPTHDRISGGQYVALVLLVAVALVGTAILIGWAAERQGILAPGTVGGGGDGTGTGSTGAGE